MTSTVGAGFSGGGISRRWLVSLGSSMSTSSEQASAVALFLFGVFGRDCFRFEEDSAPADLGMTVPVSVVVGEGAGFFFFWGDATESRDADRPRRGEVLLVVVVAASSSGWRADLLL